MIRKIEIDENGKIFHVYKIKAKHDPHNPDGGLEIDGAHADLHEDMMQYLGDYKQAYIYDEAKGLRKRLPNECGEKFRPHLKEFEDIPHGFVKRNLGKSERTL